MQNRRDFIKNAALLSGAAGWMAAMPASIQRALAIEPDAGSSFLDAEHVVILMQENRSFDHSFASLRGVRGFNDPRAITLANGNPVWVQTDAQNRHFGPMRLNIQDTKATWMGCLPHSWPDQLDARNGGRHDGWLPAKRSSNAAYAQMPLTLGYFTRQDIPFYYALADAFTICDQHFCSSLTGTIPNRLHLWTGTVRDRPSPEAFAVVRNEEVGPGRWLSWGTFPERLEEQGISWKIYQNELSTATGLTEEEDNWLANFGCNPLEAFTQYRAGFSRAARRFVEQQVQALKAKLDAAKQQLAATSSEAERRELNDRIAKLEVVSRLGTERMSEFSAENFNKLTQRERNLHSKAFCTNEGDPDYRKLAEITYQDAGVERRLRVPKGDVFHQFRQDVERGELPRVSWLVAPANFSDHPVAPWYGAWYLSETLDILTKNPQVWKKTIFLLTYDENDGYFDHVPPFTAPRPDHPESGSVSPGIDTSVEYLELDEDRKREQEGNARGGPIGLGYRVPLIIASPWSRGGSVCSQVFDHTSVLQFLEKFLTHKTGKPVEESNISRWRRVVCGDLTSVFGHAEEGGGSLSFPPRDAFLEQIHSAQFKKAPDDFHPLSADELEQVRRQPLDSPILPRQEPGVRPSCPLPYELAADGAVDDTRTRVEILLAAGNEQFGDRSAGAPFLVYAWTAKDGPQVRNYAVAAGDRLEDTLLLEDFADGRYRVQIYGPNGFFRELQGTAKDPALSSALIYPREELAAAGPAGDSKLRVVNDDPRRAYTLIVRDNAYRAGEQRQTISPHATATLSIASVRSFGWYDFSLRVLGFDRFEKRYAGHVETGRPSFTDPLMGRVDLNSSDDQPLPRGSVRENQV